MDRMKKLRPWFLAILVALLTATVAGVVWWQVERSHELMRQQVLAQAEQRGMQLADAMAGQVGGLISGIDLALRQLRREWRGDGSGDVALFDASARAMLGALPPGAVTHVTVVGADGFILYNSLNVRQRTYVGDREHFRAHLSGADRLVIGKPVLSRLGNVWTFIVNRPILRDGRFAGTMNMSVSAEHLSGKLAGLQLSGQDVIALVQTDGSFMARSQDFLQAMGRGVPANRPFLAREAPARGVVHLPGALDQLPRIYAWHRLEEYGLITAVGLARDTVLAPLNEGMRRDHAISVGLVSLMALFGGFIVLLLVRAAGRQTEIAESEAFRKRVFESSPIPIVVMDGETLECIDCNPAAVEIFRYAARRDMLGSTPLAVSAPTQYDGAPSAEKAGLHLEKVLGEGSDRFEWRYRRPDGELWDAEVHLMAFQSGQRRLIHVTLQDITERKRAEEAMRKSEERYSLAAQIGHSGAWEMWPVEGKIFFDGSLTRLLGYEEDELSEDLADWVDTVPEHARADVSSAIRAVIEGRSDQYAIEHPVRRKDGSIGWVYVKGQRVSRPGETPLRLVGSSLDVTERKRAERVLNAVNHAQSQFIAKRKASEIFNDLLDAILDLTESEYGFIGEVLHSEDGRPYIKAHGITNIAWNEETRRFFAKNAPAGLNFFKLDNLFGQVVTQSRVIIANDPANDPRSAGVPEGHPALHCFMGVPFFGDDEILGMIALANRPGGYDETLLPLLQPLLIASKNILGSLRVEKQRLAAEAALKELNEALEDRVEMRTVELSAAKEEAERANLAKSDFLSRMSHELRTPLNAILGFGQLLAMEARDAEQADNAREILHAGRHLLDLINEVLDLARIESGKFTVSREPVPLQPLIEDCLTLIRPLADARGIRITQTEGNCGEHVDADRVRLKQVLLNLLSNAVKYNREGGDIGIACIQEGGAIQVRVSDTGTGLAPEQRARLFTAFERLGADNTGVEGTGIGLALSKRLVELMRGEIGVESTPGVGSAFWIRLPAIDGHRGPPQPDAGEITGPSLFSAVHERRNVLCIEDNPANLRLVERILSRRDDIRLLSAGAPGLGLELAVAHQPALILLDINLPDMDGYEVMKCLRENPATRDIPVVAVSANAMPGDLARGKAAGFADYLTKPLEVDRLLRVMDDIVIQSAGLAVRAASRGSSATAGGEPDKPDFSGGR